MIIREKLSIIFSIAFACTVFSASGQTFTEWKNIDETHINLTEPHANVIPYMNGWDVEKREYKKSPYYQNLNGDKWKYYSVENLPDISKDYIEKQRFSSNQASDVIVPRIKETKSIANLAQLFDKTKGYSSSFIEKNNSAAIYTLNFDIATDWKNHSIFMNFESIAGAFYLWVNNQFVGYSERSLTPSEFDITPHIKTGKENTLTLLVYRLHDGSYLEFMDNLLLTGILQDVYVYAKPKVHISNYTIGAGLSRSNDGTLNVDVEIKNLDKKAGYFVELELLDNKGRTVDRYFEWIQLNKNATEKISFNKQIPRPEKWTDETPTLYTALIRIKDQKNQIIELVGDRIGFRNIEASKGSLSINGKNIILKGINYSPHFDLEGNPWSETAMINDIKTMKMHNINAVQTQNGALSRRFYELCDEYGLYIINTANISVKQSSFLRNQDWEDVLINRIETLHQRDKNHTSIIGWSLGSSIENGLIFNNAYKWLKQHDQTRLVLFEAAGIDGNTDAFFPNKYDLASVADYSHQKVTKPLIISEMGCSFGNGLGTLSNYWDIITQNPHLHGTFINEYRSKGILQESLTGKVKEKIIDKGLVSHSGEILPAMAEIKNVFKPFKVRAVNLEQGEFSIENLFNFNSLKDYRFGYIIFSNFKENGIIEGEIPIVAQPGERAEIKIRIPEIYTYGGEEYFIRFYLYQKNDSPAIAKGTELGFEDFKLKTKVQEKHELPDYDYHKIEAIIKGDLIEITNREFSLDFNTSTGMIETLSFENEPLITQASLLEFVRPTTFSNKIRKETTANELQNIKYIIKDLKHRQQNEYTYLIDVLFDVMNANEQEKLMNLSQSYIILGNGDILLNNQLLINNKSIDITKIGWQFELSKSLTNADWFGRETESYVDRKNGAKLGVYRLPVETLQTNYSIAQENGNRTDVRWVAFTDSVKGLFIDFVDTLFNFSVYPYSNNTLNKEIYTNELNQEDFWTLNIDYKNEGIGLGYPNAELPKEYQLTNEKYHFTIHLRPFSSENITNPENFRMNALPIIQNEVLPMPFISKNRTRFDSIMTITLSSPIPEAVIYYTLDNSEPTDKSLRYAAPFNIKSSTTVKARLFAAGKTPSFVAKKDFKYELVSKVTFENQPNTPYNRNLETVLIDSYDGNLDFKEDSWLGFSRNDFIANVELKTNTDLKQVSITFGHDPDSWVFLPENASISFSEDGETYSQPISVEMPFESTSETESTVKMETIALNVNQKNIKYIKIQAKNIQKIPTWHRAKGLNAWILVSEISILENTAN